MSTLSKWHWVLLAFFSMGALGSEPLFPNLDALEKDWTQFKKAAPFLKAEGVASEGATLFRAATECGHIRAAGLRVSTTRRVHVVKTLGCETGAFVVIYDPAEREFFTLRSTDVLIFEQLG